jgi:hypothetical protein
MQVFAYVVGALQALDYYRGWKRKSSPKSLMMATFCDAIFDGFDSLFP